MLRTVLQFAEAAERLIGQVYGQLALYLEEDSEPHKVLIRLASEEATHARIIAELMDTLPGEDTNMDYEAVFQGQAEFINCCSQLLSTDPVTADELTGYIERLVRLEGTLSDNLFLHLKLIADDRYKNRLEKLAEASSGHARLLTQFLPAVERNVESIIP